MNELWDSVKPWLPLIPGILFLLFVVTFIGFYIETRSMSLTWLKMFSLARHIHRFKREVRDESKEPRRAVDRRPSPGTISEPVPRVKPPRRKDEEE